MTIYKTVYPWEVIDEIKNGKTVWVLDKGEHETFTANEASTEQVVEAVYAPKSEGRYEFWIETDSIEEPDCSENTECLEF